MIRRLIAQHLKRNGRKAKLWGHPSKLAGPMGWKKGKGTAVRWWKYRQAKGQAARLSPALTHSVTLSESL